MILTNILQRKKHGAVQTVSSIARNFLLLAIELNCSDTFSSKNNLFKLVFTCITQDVQSLKKNSSKEMQEKPLSHLLFLAMLTS